MSVSKQLSDSIIEQTETVKWITEFISNSDLNDQELMTIGYLTNRLTLIESYWSTFVKQHLNIVRYKNADTTSYVMDNVFATTERAYSRAVGRINSELDKATAALEGARPPTRAAVAAAPAQSIESVARQIQLPKVNLPSFNGDPMLWESFRYLFKSMVHEISGLGNVQKFMYLKSCLTDEAAEVIKNTPVTSVGYIGAWEDLESCYGNPRVISATYMRNLFSIVPITKSSASEIKRLLDASKQSVRAFTSLQKPINQWDEFFVYILVQKLDVDTRLAWETSLADSKAIPTLQQLTDFLENRVHALDAAYSNDPTFGALTGRVNNKPKHPASSTPKVFATTTDDDQTIDNARPKRSCPQCNNNHNLGYCGKFKALSATVRRDKAVKSHVCLNCLRYGHAAKNCPSKSRCIVCNEAHHTLIHTGSPNRPINTAVSADYHLVADLTSTADTDADSKISCMHTLSAERAVLLATARVRLTDTRGKEVIVRALLDSASESSFVSERVVRTLGVETKPAHVKISGLRDCEAGFSTREVHLLLRTAGNENFSASLNAYVLPQLTRALPQEHILVKPWKHLDQLPLADPNYATPGPIDALIGAELCGYLFFDQSRRGAPNEPMARLTPFGWVLTGAAESEAHPTGKSNTMLHVANVQSLFTFNHFWDIPNDGEEDDTSLGPATQSFVCTADNEAVRDDSIQLTPLIERFWRIEEVSTTSPLTEEEQQCEKHFTSTHQRDNPGRYIVRLPFRQDPGIYLKSNRNAALALMMSTERKMQRDPELKQLYSAFMQEYEALGHMSPTLNSNKEVLLPHHGVLRHVPRPKLRVVFNASHVTPSGASLNDCLMSGPKLQAELWLVLTHWRELRIVFTADIIKMFRQIKIHENDRKWQHILWRCNPDDDLKSYTLNTVTYGTSCAPYLAQRVLRQLATDEGSAYPLGVDAVRNRCYVDDFFSGGDNVPQALEAKDQLVNLLAAGGLHLDKWASNVQQLCPNSPTSPICFQDDSEVSTLGVIWNPASDTFALKFTRILDDGKLVTKRSVLSCIAQLFDPAGWFAPVLVTPNIMIQDMWIMGLDWNQPLPAGLAQKWNDFRASLPELESIQIPRWLHTHRGKLDRIELHAITDASERAYSAVVYLRVIDNGKVTCTLLTCKTKVAPVRTVSLPRLELCGALLLSRLVKRLQTGLPFVNNIPTLAWTDSKVTLASLQSHASRWTTFVANRVAEIQDTLPAAAWHHVASADNPANAATRGITPAELRNSSLWWHGPEWLQNTTAFLPDEKYTYDTTDLEKSSRTKVFVAMVDSENPLFERYSSLDRLVRITAWCLRFRDNALHPEERRKGSISANELENALRIWIQHSQRNYFASELAQLHKNQPLKPASKLLSVTPFIDDKGVLRVGGRLQEAGQEFDVRHPILIPHSGRLTSLIAQDTHARALHVGQQLTSSIITSKYWILNLRSAVRSVIHHCVVCTRHRGKTMTQLMGNLPSLRVVPARPFLATGVDFAGPFMIRTTHGRGHRAYKGYICLFVCLVTKAVHLEAASGLSTNDFMQAYRRFISRRGRCQTLMSDNGTNFVGADKALTDMFKESSEFYGAVRQLLLADRTDWVFIPPRAPHFGGLWEAGVKSVKGHLHRVIGNSTLTFEEISTLLAQIEACLNSRPLTPLSSDVSDLQALTPGHFLIGEPLISLPEPGLPDIDMKSVARHHRLEQIRDSLWKRWSSEYLHQLQECKRWVNTEANIEVGALVLIKDENYPPSKWPLARVTQVHAGPDGAVRVVSVRTANNDNLQRPVTKLCPLPVET